MNATLNAKSDGRLARILSQAPAAPGLDYASWLTTWCQSGARDEASDATLVVTFKPHAEREPKDYLDEDNLHPMRKLLTRHPGAPMAFAEMCRKSSGFQRLRALIEYLKVQADHPSVTNASDQGSTTIYVSPLHINEVMRGYQVEDEDLAEQEIARMRSAAREHVVRDLLSIAATASDEAFASATGTWFRKEYARRQSAENVATAGAAATAMSRGAPSALSAATPASVPSSPPASQRQAAKRADGPSGERPPERPLGFGFARRPG